MSLNIFSVPFRTPLKSRQLTGTIPANNPGVCPYMVYIWTINAKWPYLYHPVFGYFPQFPELLPVVPE